MSHKCPNKKTLPHLSQCTQTLKRNNTWLKLDSTYTKKIWYNVSLTAQSRRRLSINSTKPTKGSHSAHILIFIKCLSNLQPTQYIFEQMTPSSTWKSKVDLAPGPHETCYSPTATVIYIHCTSHQCGEATHIYRSQIEGTFLRLCHLLRAVTWSEYVSFAARRFL